MLILKSPPVVWNLFLVVSLNAPLVAGPKPVEQGRKVENPFTSERLAAQGRRASENGGNSSQEQRGSVARIKDWDDLLNEQTSQQSGEAPKEGTLEQLAQAAQQAYQRGDEDHPDWDRVAGLVEDLRPENGEDHAKRRLSVGDKADQAKEAEAEELQLHFFLATLPAIKKTSVVAALRGLNNFKTAAIIEKANEEQCAWKEAKASFEVVCRDRMLHGTDNSRIHTVTSQEDDTDFYLPGPFEAYLQKLNYKINRSEIENQLDALHHEIIQGIINANVTTDTFEERALNAQEIAARYQPLLGLIAAAKKIADPAVQHKWEQFEQEAAARCLEDLSQVAKIKLWQNRNQVASINKVAERAHEQAERGAGAEGWQMAFEEGEAAKDAWIERNNRLAAARENIEAHKKTVSLTISTAIEKEIETAIRAAQQAIAYWEGRSAQVPLRIIGASINHTRSLYQIALEQYEFEKQLKRNGNPVLARYNKEKYLGLARKQYGKTMLLVQELKDDASRVLDAALEESIEKFQDDHYLLGCIKATEKSKAAQQQEEVDEANGDARASKQALSTTSQTPLADDSALR